MSHPRLLPFQFPSHTVICIFSDVKVTSPLQATKLVPSLGLLPPKKTPHPIQRMTRAQHNPKHAEDTVAPTSARLQDALRCFPTLFLTDFALPFSFLPHMSPPL